MSKKNKNKHRDVSHQENEVHSYLSGTTSTPAPSAQPSSPPSSPPVPVDAPLPLNPEQLRDELRKRNSGLDERERMLRQREDAVAQRESLAEAGFKEQERKALAVHYGEREELARQVAQVRNQLAGEIERQVTAERDRRLKSIADEFETVRREQMRLLETDLAAKRADALALIEQHKRSFDEWQAAQRVALDRTAKDLAAKETSLSDREDAFRRRQSDLEVAANTRLADLMRRESEVTVAREFVDAEKVLLPKRVEAKVQAAREDFDATLRSREEALNRARSDRERLQARVDELEELFRTFGQKKPDEILKDMQSLHGQLTSLRNEHSQCPSRDLKDRYASLDKKKAALEQENSRLARENGELNAKSVKWSTYAAELEGLRNQKEVAERRLVALNALVDKYEEDVNRLKSLHELPKERETRIGVIELPYFKREDIRRSERNGDTSEIDWLDSIHARCLECDILFNRRLLYAFHTALKTSEWSPLTVLAGVSGTGKSELPRLYARFGGLMFLPIAVQPNWDSPQDLFGFFNYGENRFNSKPLVQAMTQMQRDPDDRQGLTDALLLVLLDEMNLAHIELYFSDLLSALERRRGEQSVAVEIDLGSGLEKYPLTVGRNILWSGTMNEDETTKSLSDKVLDRGNLISFPRPRAFQRRKKLRLSAPAPILPSGTWDKWVKGAHQFADDELSRWKIAVEELNGYLEPVGRALGHRVWQSMENYMAHHPLVITAPAEGRSAALCRAFEDQLVQKVMPKLRGIETRGHSKTDCLDKIMSVIQRDAPGLSTDFQKACIGGHGFFLWNSAAYLENESSERQV